MNAAFRTGALPTKPTVYISAAAKLAILQLRALNRECSAVAGILVGSLSDSACTIHDIVPFVPSEGNVPFVADGAAFSAQNTSFLSRHQNVFGDDVLGWFVFG